MYLMLATRPDISFAVNKAAQYSACYNNTHWTAVKRILRYLKGTSNYALTLGGRDESNVSGSSLSGSNQGNGNASLSGACDADWGNDIDDRRSTTGYLFSINRGTISWQTRKQPSVATSSTQAEYMALSTATKEALWIRELMKELCIDPTQTDHTPAEPTLILQDNQSTIALAHNPINHGRTKHIDIQHHFIRECIETAAIHLEYIPTDRMLADALTKPLPGPKFKQCIEHIGVTGV